MFQTKINHWKLFKTSLQEFFRADSLNLAASLSYYTIFSLAPMLIVIIALSSLFLGKEAVTGALFYQIRGMVGNEAAETIQTMLAHAYQPKSSLIATIIGLTVLFVGSTGVFAQMQYCLNRIWDVKPKANGKKDWVKQIRNRFLSFSILLAIVFLLLVSLAISTVFAAFWNYLSNFIPNVSIVMLKLFEITLSIGFTTLLFTLMFKFLPDVKVPWKNVWRGGALTALLFEIGKNGISFYLGKSSVASAYGAAGTIVIILLWVNYSALILFWGTSYTKAFTALYGAQVEPEEYAVAKEKEPAQVKVA